MQVEFSTHPKPFGVGLDLEFERARRVHTVLGSGDRRTRLLDMRVAKTKRLSL
jgi:hypothetical protein